MTPANPEDPEKGSRRVDRSLLAEIVNASPVVLFALERSNVGLLPVWMCPNIRRILNLAPIASGDVDWWFDAVHPEDRSRVETKRMQLAEDGPQKFEFRLNDGAGTYRWIREEIRAPDSTESREVDAVGSWSDVTARRMLEVRLRHSGRMEVLGRFAGGVAHEFNNLLTVIRGNVDLLSSKAGTDGASGTELGEIEEAAKRAQRVVSQLLAHSKDRTMGFESVDMSALIRSASSELREILGAEIDLRISTEGSMPEVRIDPVQFRQILIHLAANARDAMHDGGSFHVATRVVSVGFDESSLSELLPGSYVAVEIEDTGEGMDETTLRKAFDPFFTTRTHTDRTGLGLSTVHGLVTQAGGKVDLDSTPGEGTKVTIHLPVSSSSNDELT